MNFGINQLLHRAGLHITRHSDPGRLSWIVRNLDTTPSLLRWLAPEIIREHQLKTFVQVGANDGQVGDPLEKCIERFGLQGVMVEPQPGPCALLRQKYASVDRITIDQVAIDNEEGVLTLYHFGSAHVATRSAMEVKADLLTSGDRKHMERMRDSMGLTAEIHEMKVPALTWKGLLSKHHLSNPDLVIVDTEGMDDRIVNQIELGEDLPALIQFEHLHLDSGRLNACTKRLLAAGYRLITTEYDVLCLHHTIWGS